jgi:hypothetical protein
MLEKGNFQFVGIACYPVMFSIIIKVEEIFSVFGPISLTEYRHQHFRRQKKLDEAVKLINWLFSATQPGFNNYLFSEILIENFTSSIKMLNLGW